MIINIKAFHVLALCLSFSAYGFSSPFNGADYHQTSREAVAHDELTVVFQYPAAPCGTLMTEFTKPGSVSLGRGPVYELMVQSCQAKNFGSFPIDATVRTYACQNIAKEEKILGKATFGFKCEVGPTADAMPVKKPLNRIPSNLY